MTSFPDLLSEAIRDAADRIEEPSAPQVLEAIRRGRHRRGLRYAVLGLVVAAVVSGVTVPLVFLSALRPPSDTSITPTPAVSPSPEEALSPPEGAGPFHPETYREDGLVVMPVTFPDGTTAEVLFPEELGTGSIGPFAYLDGMPRECHPEVKPVRAAIVGSWTRPGAPLAVFPGAGGEPVGFWQGRRWTQPWDVLAFDFGSWAGVIPCNVDPVEDADTLALVARSVDAREAEDGFLVITPRPPIELVRTGDQVGPRLQFEQETGPGREFRLVSLTISGCSPSSVALAQGGGTAHGCFEGGIDLYAAGDREFLNQVVESLQVRKVQPPG
ncbi:MAG: hypothetical protein ACRDHV_01700 [Actinomycetota bacterium]